MREETFKSFYQNYKKGSYVVLEKVTIKNGFVKKTKMVVRFVNYYNIASVKAKYENGMPSTKARDYEEQIIPHILKLNKNTNNLLLCVYVTNHHKVYNTYYYQDMEISEEEYYTMSGDVKKNNNPSVIYNMKLQDILSIGGIE